MSTECSLLGFQTERYNHLRDFTILRDWKNININCSLDHLEAIDANTVPWLQYDKSHTTLLISRAMLGCLKPTSLWQVEREIARKERQIY